MKKVFILTAALLICACSAFPARAGEEEAAQKVTKGFFEVMNRNQNPYGLLTKASQQFFFNSIFNDFIQSNNLREADAQFKENAAEYIRRELLDPDSRYSLYLGEIFTKSWVDTGISNMPITETVVSGDKAYSHFIDNSYLKLLKEDGKWKIGFIETYNMCSK
ncbi:hypothetical protein IJT93_07140 [bacterium]|nr:hypothetical protein [bacterium]